MLVKIISIFIEMFVCGGILVYRKLPNKKTMEVANKYKNELKEIEDKAKTYGTTPDALEISKLNKKIRENENFTITFDPIDFIILSFGIFLSVGIYNSQGLGNITVFIANCILYTSGFIYLVLIGYRNRLKNIQTDGINDKKTKNEVYEQMILKNPEYKKLNISISYILPIIIIISGMIAKYFSK